MHCVQSEKSLMRIATFCTVGRTGAGLQVAQRKQMKGFERHQYDLVLNMIPERKPMESL